MQVKNRYNFENTRPQSRKQQAVGVDLRLVIIASLVVGMLLVQVILVETYSGKKPTRPPFLVQQPNEQDQVLPMDAVPPKEDLTELNSDQRRYDKELTEEKETLSPTSVMTLARESLLPVRNTLPPTRATEHVDIAKLEEQLKELQDIQVDEEEELEGKEVLTPPPPPLDAGTSPIQSSHVVQPSSEDEEIVQLSPTVEQDIDQQTVIVQTTKEHHHHHHTSKTGSSSSSSTSSSSSSSSGSSSSSSHSSKSCRTRRHLFRSYKTPPRIVCFVSGHHDKADALDPLWRQSFQHLGFQETQNPSLATFLMSKHSSEPKLKEFCSDSQVFNHVKSTRSLTNPVSLSKSVARQPTALKFHPESAIYGGFSSSVSHSSKKTACATFMSKGQEYLRMASIVRNTMLAAYVEKHDKVVAKLSMGGLRKMVESYKKSGTCPHSDDTVVVQAFKNILLTENDNALCSLRTFLYIPSTKPVMVFMSARAIILRCFPIEKDSLDLFSIVAGNETEPTKANAARYYSLLEFRDKLLQENRFPTPVIASVSFKELIQKLKRAIGSMVSAAKYKLEVLPGRFGLMSADFVLDSFSLQPTLIKITDVPELSSVENRFPGVVHTMLNEVIRSQQTLLKRVWSNAKDTIRPESLRALSDFELCGYETTLSKQPDGKEAEAGTTDIFRIFPFV